MKRISFQAAFGGAALVALAGIAYTQCATDNATCVGSDCPNFGAGAVEYASGVTKDNVTFQSFKADVWASGSKNGEVIKNTLPAFTRGGAESIKHAVWGPDKAAGQTGKRAELSDLAIQRHPNKDAAGNRYFYWYGWSLYIPDDANWSSPTLRQFIGQWRFPNTNGCVTMKNCAGGYVGGSGHHLMIENGQMVFTMEVPDTSCGTAGRLRLIKTDLGAPAKGVWMDIMMQAKWAPTDGRVRVWIQKNGGGYKPAMDYSGSTWLDRFNATPACGFNGQEAMAPNWQVGLYWSNDSPLPAQPRVVYSDEMKMFRTLCPDTIDSDGWKRSRPDAPVVTPAVDAANPQGANSLSVELESQIYTKSNGDTTSPITDATMASADEWVKFNANAVNDSLQTTIPVATGGTYNLKARARKYTSRGIADLYINGNLIGSWDQYGPDSYVEKDYGNVVLKSGANTFMWKISGKNALSTGYDLSLDKLTLAKP